MPLNPESYVEPEVGVAVVVTAAAASPSLRKVVRRSLVYGLAGALIAYDKVAAAAQGLVRGIRKGATEAASKAAEPAPTPPPASEPTAS
jgi:hypothetical protein